MCANLCFSSTRVAWWLINKNVIFLLSRFIFACRLVLYLYACEMRILKFQDSLYQKAEVCAQTINEWRKSKRSVVLLRRQTESWLNSFRSDLIKNTNSYIYILGSYSKIFIFLPGSFQKSVHCAKGKLEELLSLPAPKRAYVPNTFARANSSNPFAKKRQLFNQQRVCLCFCYCHGNTIYKFQV